MSPEELIKELENAKALLEKDGVEPTTLYLLPAQKKALIDYAKAYMEIPDEEHVQYLLGMEIKDWPFINNEGKGDVTWTRA